MPGGTVFILFVRTSAVAGSTSWRRFAQMSKEIESDVLNQETTANGSS